MTKILVVDDEPFCIELMVRLLPKEYEIETASNGKEALIKVKEMSPDLILLDVIMPELNGYEVCRQLKSDVTTMSIPVVIVTSLKEREERLKAIEAGVDDFLSKPVDAYELKARVKSLLRIKKYHDELVENQEMLRVLNEQLEDRVKEKTASFAAEVEVRKKAEENLRMTLKELARGKAELEIANKNLEVALAELKSLDNLKDNILSNVTHELRTPLTHAIGFLELAMDETDELKKMELLRKCMDALLHENAVIARLIESAYAGKGLLKPVFKTMNVGEMIQEIIQALSPKAQAYSVDVSSKVEDKLFAKGDSNQIKHVLENLLDNAIKFNRKGGKVEISASVKDEMVEVCFMDTGIGIPEDKLCKLFEKMYQVNSDTTRKFGGMGIGLSIAKFMVEAHKGRIWVESKAGEGSRFCFTIPAGKGT